MDKPLDIALDLVDEALLESAKHLDEYKFVLDAKLKEIEKVDNKIKWFEQKQTEMQKQKHHLYKGMNDLLELAETTTHTLQNGFKVMPDNKFKVEVEDTLKFLGWLKKNKDPDDVLKFFTGALKIANLKGFCEKEFNLQRVNGEMEPSIDGINFGDMKYRKLTTVKEKKK